MRNHPLGLVEATSSIRILEYDVRPYFGGPGRWRGGVGQTITAEVLCDGGIILARGLDRMRFPAWAIGRIARRQTGAYRQSWACRSTSAWEIHELHVRRGDTITLGLPGGGGYGDPLQRDPRDVLTDVQGGFVTCEAATHDYGVVFADGAVDASATEAARASRKRTPSNEFGFGPDRERWEQVFTDAAMTELNDRLYALPKAVRHDIRRAVFEAVVPGITQSAGRPITEPLTDLPRRLAACVSNWTRWRSRMQHPYCRIGIDVGGTFTDFVLADRIPAAWSVTRNRVYRWTLRCRWRAGCRR